MISGASARLSVGQLLRIEAEEQGEVGLRRRQRRERLAEQHPHVGLRQRVAGVGRRTCRHRSSTRVPL